MLETLRKSAGGTIAKIFIGLLVLSFAIWGIGDVFRGFGERDLAQVGSRTIDVESFRYLYQERLQQLSRQLGRPITPDQARSLGLDRQLLGEIVSETALDEKGRELGLNISDATLLSHIHANPAFRGPNGSFNPSQFYEALRSAGYTEARYIDSERRLILRQQLARALGGDVAAPSVLRQAVHRFENEQRDIEYVVLDREQAGEIPAPGPSEIDTFFEERKSAFRAPEYRRVVVIALTAEALAEQVEIPEEELRKAFEDRRERVATPERREVEQIVFPDAAEAQAAAARMAKGATFEDIVAERELAPGDVSLGLVTKRQILDPAVADAVFDLPQNVVSKPLKSQFGIVLARVTRIEPGKEPSFDELADTLRKSLALAQARNSILDQYDRIEDERAAGSRIPEVASKLGLKAITIEAVDRSGRGPYGEPIEGIPGLSEVVAGAFDTEIGVETDPIEIGNGTGYVWYEVTDITPSRDRTLAEVRDRVEAAWRDEQVSKRLTERAETIRKRLAAGEPLAAVAPALKVERREDLQRGRAAEGLSRDLLSSVFGTPQGEAGVATAGDGTDRIVFRVTEVTAPTADADASERVTELSTGLQDDLLVQYVLYLQDQLGVRVNEAALRSVTGGDTGS